MKDMLRNKTSTGSMFAVCRFAKGGGVISTCHGKPASADQSFVETSEQYTGKFPGADMQGLDKLGFIQDILAFVRMLKPLFNSEMVELNEGAAKAKEDVSQLMKNIINSMNMAMDDGRDTLDAKFSSAKDAVSSFQRDMKDAIDGSMQTASSIGKTAQSAFEDSMNSAQGAWSDSIDSSVGAVSGLATATKSDLEGAVDHGQGVLRNGISSAKGMASSAQESLNRPNSGTKTMLADQQAEVSFLEHKLTRINHLKSPKAAKLEENKIIADKEHAEAKSALQKAEQALAKASESNYESAKESFLAAQLAESTSDKNANGYLKELFKISCTDVRTISETYRRAKSEKFSILASSMSGDENAIDRNVDADLKMAEKKVHEQKKRLDDAMGVWRLYYSEIISNYEASLMWKASRVEKALSNADHSSVNNDKSALSDTETEYFSLLETAKRLKEHLYFMSIEQRDEIMDILRDSKEPVVSEIQNDVSSVLQKSKIVEAAEEAAGYCGSTLTEFNIVASAMKNAASTSIKSAEVRLRKVQGLVEVAQRDLEDNVGKTKEVAQNTLQAAFESEKDMSNLLKDAERRALSIREDIKRARNKAVDRMEARLKEAKDTGQGKRCVCYCCR